MFWLINDKFCKPTEPATISSIVDSAFASPTRFAVITLTLQKAIGLVDKQPIPELDVNRTLTFRHSLPLVTTEKEQTTSLDTLKLYDM